MIRTARPSLVSLVLPLVFSAVSTARAATAISPPDAPQATFSFDIPAGPLTTVIATFEAITGLTVTAPPRATVQGLNSPGVSGTCTAAQALQQLLAGTGLSFRRSGANAYQLEVRPVSESVEVRGELPPYRVDTSVSAMKTLTALRDVPQSVTVISQAAIADQRMQSMADVVRYVPGAGMAQGEGNRDTPIFRGNSTTADFFVDGVRDDVQYFRDLYNVERVEAIMGPNAMIFGRGGAGGVINRATRQADWGTTREVTLQGGSNDNRRLTFDVDHPVSRAVATRLTGMYENSDSYRRGVTLERYGFNPTMVFMPRKSTTIRAGYERFHDDRTADRGVPSFGDRPILTDASAFFGDPDSSRAFVTVDAFTSVVDHTLSPAALLRNRTRYASYDKFYQNVYPGSAVAAGGTTASLAAYNNSTDRQNVFNQTDVSVTAASGRVKHVLVAGAEFGRQATDNLRNTGYFTSLGPNAIAYSVPVSAPTVSVPMTFRHSPTDADNSGVATVAAVYAQDQIDVSSRVQAVVGLRYDRFDVDFHNNRTNADFASRDNLVSPRAGFIYKPVAPVSIYTSYSLAYLPRAGEQLSSLSLTNQALDPERFTNHEVGAKWDVRPGLSVTTAVYRLHRTNVVIPDPADASRSLLVDGQRTNGVELGITGTITRKWSAMGGYAFQDGRITRTLSLAAQAGAVLAQVPAHTLSLWNRYNFAPRWGVGLGVVHSSDMFTSTDNSVVLPGFTRVDGAVFVTLTRRLRAQMNLENLFDEHYYPFANGNNNITPGSPRAMRASLTTSF
jgi:catecholate siderophore receptor